MKTSNIILVSFIVFIFLSPLLIALALASKVGGNDFRVMKNFNHTRASKVRTADFKVVNLRGNSRNFRCSIVKDDSSFIEYHNYNDDTVSFTEAGDTLNLVFNPPSQSAGTNENGFVFTVHSRYPGSIIVENMSVQVSPNDYFKSNPLELTLRRDAYVSFLDSKRTRDESDSEVDTTNGYRGSFQELRIKSDQSEVVFHRQLEVGRLTLECYNGSKLSLPAGVRYQQLSGTISDDTEVRADWQTLKKLKSR